MQNLNLPQSFFYMANRVHVDNSANVKRGGNTFVFYKNKKKYYNNPIFLA